MSNLKLCQGPSCHTYHTQDRLKGIKGSKTYQTRRRSHLYYGNGNFCDQRCMYAWVNKYIEQGLDHFCRTTEPKHLTEDNAWVKDYDYNWRNDNNPKSNWRSVNKVTQEQRPMTEEQYNDRDYTLNTN